MQSWMPFEMVVALRFLREGRTQTMLILFAVAVGVAVAVFLSALIQGLQSDLIEKTLGAQPHITVEAAENILASRERQISINLAQIQQPPQILRGIPQWKNVLSNLKNRPGLVDVAPVLGGSGVALRGAATQPVFIKGVDFPSWSPLAKLAAKMVSGLPSATGASALVGVDFAAKMGVGLGDRFRVETPIGRSDLLTVAGIFDFRNANLNEQQLLVAIPLAQNLFDQPGTITAIELTIPQIFAAETTAKEIVRQTGLSATSWMEANAQLLAGLRAQSSSSFVIQFFVAVAVALGISSVLAVAVVQKSREIGILRATGTSAGQVLRIFLLQGFFVGLLGSAVGSVLGAGLSALFRNSVRNPDGTPRFPLDLDPSLFATAMILAALVGLAAAIVPARRAALLDPAVVIRYG